MARGFLGGFVVGTGLSFCVAAVGSFVAGPPAPPQIVSDAPVVADVPADDASSPGQRLPEGDPRQPATSGISAPDVTDDPAMAADALRPAARPRTARVTTDVPEPAAPAGAETFVPDAMAPVRPRSRALLPGGAPDTDRQAAMPTEPQRPATTGITLPGRLSGDGDGMSLHTDRPMPPVADEPLSGLGDAPAPVGPGQPDVPGVETETAPRPDAAPPRMVSDPGEPAASAGMLRAPQPMASGPVRPADQPGMPDTLPAGDTAAPEFDTRSDETSARPEAAEDGAARIETAGEGRPTIGTPATSLMDRETAAAGQITEETPAADEGDQPALLRHAAPFTNPRNLPLLSIILVDTGEDLDGLPVGLAALDSFPYPLSFAVDTSLPDAGARAQRHRSEGNEVLALVNLPPNLTASDTEVALPALLDRVPQSVAVLEGIDSGMQGSVEMSAQVSAILTETGHGIVWRPGALGSAQRRSEREGVPAHTFFRIFDSEGETALEIRRFLDKAAFKAAQEGPVIVVGRLRPETITALIIWGLQDDTRRVAVAPVSAAIRAAEESG